jgi:hypothetical protein
MRRRVPSSARLHAAPIRLEYGICKAPFPSPVLLGCPPSIRSVIYITTLKQWVAEMHPSALSRNESNGLSHRGCRQRRTSIHPSNSAKQVTTKPISTSWLIRARELVASPAYFAIDFFFLETVLRMNICPVPEGSSQFASHRDIVPGSSRATPLLIP